MENNNQLYLESTDIRNKIYTIRGAQVMLDRDIAFLYEVETRVINQAVKRNIERFPQEYYFQLTENEFDNWKSQIVMSNSDKIGLRRCPYVFTERGIAMLSTVLHSAIAIKVSMNIMDAFVAMRHYLANNALIFKRLDSVLNGLTICFDLFTPKKQKASSGSLLIDLGFRSPVRRIELDLTSLTGQLNISNFIRHGQ